MEVEIGSVIKALPKKKGQGLNDFTTEFYKAFQEELTPIPHKLFKTIEWEAMLPNMFCESNTTLMAKPERDSTEKESHRPTSLMNTDAKILNKILANSTETHQRDYFCGSTGIHPGHARMVQYFKYINL